jgi:hypothetical protein
MTPIIVFLIGIGIVAASLWARLFSWTGMETGQGRRGRSWLRPRGGGNWLQPKGVPQEPMRSHGVFDYKETGSGDPVVTLGGKFQRFLI